MIAPTHFMVDRQRAGVRSLAAVVPLAVLSLCSCAQDDGGVVAQVGERVITAADLREFVAGLSGKAGEETPGAEQGRVHLRTMIDRELMLLEARNQELDNSIAYLTRIDRARRAKLLSLFEDRTIRISVDDAELDDFIDKERLNRAIRIADIKVPDLEAAQAAVEEIRAGADFSDVARKRSTNRETAVRGGDVGRYVMKGQMIFPLEQALFPLALGEVSEPIRIGRSYAIFKILDETTVDLNTQQKAEALRGLREAKFRAARDSVVAELKREYKLRVHQDGMKQFVEALLRGARTGGDDPFDMVLYSFDGGEVTAADFLKVAKDSRRNVPASLDDAEKVIAFAERNVLPDILIVEAAVRGGIDSEPEFVAWAEEQGEQVLVRGLRAKHLMERVDITEADIRAYYEANADRFLHPEQIEVQEILVESESEALRLTELVEGGASLAELAGRHSIRSREVRDEEGRFHVHQHESPQFGGFVEHAVAAEIGVLTGPVPVQEGYSVFKVLSRERKRETFEEARKRAQSQLRRKLHKEEFNEYLETLRERYQSLVTVNEEAATAALADR
ncbi:MAG: peptidyl-prolyl cis-trans isomerase [Candidatus Aminicenantes bacterium]|nr:peptidyl-prolyl cis-trans isomerase [Candidatus Aminicenantes bacterium]